MQSEEDLSVIESVDQFDDPLDRLESTDTNDPMADPEEMLPKLSDEDPSQRMLAARAFCELQDSRAIAPLIKLLEDICPLVRVSAAYALGRNTSPEAVTALIDLLGETGTDTFVKALSGLWGMVAIAPVFNR